MWETRTLAEQALDSSLMHFRDLLSEAFDSVDRSVSRLEQADTPFGRICALVTIKAKNLAMACYSLSLDALAQESGAIFRVLIEALELLQYLREDPKRVTEALDGRLPKAGEIAKRIKGNLQKLRDHLNAHASHLSVGPESMRHLLDFNARQHRTAQPYSESVFRTNLATILTVVLWLATEAATCASIAKGEANDPEAEKIDDLKGRSRTHLTT
jgi:hypothetical protein